MGERRRFGKRIATAFETSLRLLILLYLFLLLMLAWMCARVTEFNLYLFLLNWTTKKGGPLSNQHFHYYYFYTFLYEQI